MPGSGRVSWTGWFSLELPDGWQHSQEGSVISLFNEDSGVGAIQISCIKRKKSSAPAAAEAIQLAKDYARQRGWDVQDGQIATYRVAGSPAAEFTFTEYGDATAFWQVWHISEQTRAVFITYNSAPEDADKELSARQKIIRSFVWEPR
jgi:hypothetical protein